MTSKNFLESNKGLLIGAISTKISRLQQKVRWSEKNEPDDEKGQERIIFRKEKIEQYKTILNVLDNGTIH